VIRARLRFTKLGKVRFTSHRDVARMWERAIRRVELPMAYSEGFSPHPKLHFGLALSTGHESLAEYLDVDLDPGSDVPAVDVAALPERLTPALPVGIEVTAAAVVPAATPSLQQAVTSCTWQIDVAGAEPHAVSSAVDDALAASALVITRQRKGSDVTDDVRPYLLDLAVTGPANSLHGPGAQIEAHLATQPRGLRITELLSVLGDGLAEGRVCRTHQWTSYDGARREPLPPGATSAPHAQARAS